MTVRAMTPSWSMTMPKALAPSIAAMKIPKLSTPQAIGEAICTAGTMTWRNFIML